MGPETKFEKGESYVSERQKEINEFNLCTHMVKASHRFLLRARGLYIKKIYSALKMQSIGITDIEKRTV